MSSGGRPDASQRLERFLSDLEGLDDDAIFISIGDPAALRVLASKIDAMPVTEAPLRGLVFGVKDNIDVAGMPTTAGCPGFAYDPPASAAVVERLVQAGALPVAKTNLDQFATGLVGTRSPYGVPRNPFDPDHVPGGSSSGSAVATARGLVDFALGTDTAGSGRVPAAFCGVVGVKPTVGRLSTSGVVPAVRTMDCVSIFATDVALAGAVLEAATGFVPADPYSRRRPLTPVVFDGPRFGVLTPASLAAFGADAQTIAAYGRVVDGLSNTEVIEIDFTPFASAGDLLYGGPWVGERTHAVGSFVVEHRHEVDAGIDPIVAEIIEAGGIYGAVDVFDAAHRLAGLRRQVDETMAAIDVLMLPTTPHGASLVDVSDDPIGVNTALGRFTTFANMMELAGVSIPMRSASSAAVPFGVSLYGAAWTDEALLGLAADLLEQPRPRLLEAGGIPLVVAGAHLKGQPLEWQLTGLGAIWRETTKTAPTYRLFALDGAAPKKPGVVFDTEGASLEVDVWELTPAALGTFLTMVPAPLALGTVTLADGRHLNGFVCEPRALEGATEVTSFGGWRAYVAHTT